MPVFVRHLMKDAARDAVVSNSSVVTVFAYCTVQRMSVSYTVASQTLTVNCFGPCSSKTVARTRPFFSGARSALFSTRALSGVTVRVLCVQFVVPSSRLTQVCPRTFTLRLVYVLRVVLPFEP